MTPSPAPDPPPEPAAEPTATSASSMAEPSTPPIAESAIESARSSRGKGLRSVYLRLAVLVVLVLGGRLLVAAIDDDGSPGGATRTTRPGSTAPASTATTAPVEMASIATPPPFLVRSYDAGGPPGTDAVFTDATTGAGTTFDHHGARVTATRIPKSQLAALVGSPDPTPAQTARWVRSTLSPFLVEQSSLRYFATGQAWGDVDGDGDPDLYLTDQQGPNVLFENRGDGTFVRSPLSKQVALSGTRSGGAVFADYDDDGWPDLLVLGDGSVTLFHNQQGKGFRDVTARSGLRNPAQGETATWGDFDGDGDLDVYFANYGCQPCNEAPPAPKARRDQDRLFRNDGDGRFTDLTKAISKFSATRGLAFSAGWFDYDDDGRPDLYVVNDVRDDEADDEVAADQVHGDGSTPGNVLLHNDGPGCGSWCFSDRTKAAGVDVRADAMGLTIGDVDGNGTPDLFFTNGGYRAGPTKLLTNDGDGTFTDAGAAQGANLGEWSWGCNLLDADSDGRPDVYVAVGYSELVMQATLGGLPEDPVRVDPVKTRIAVTKGTIRAVGESTAPPWPVVASTAPRTDNDRILLQRSAGTFDEVVLGPTDRFSGHTLGSAVADYDGDGRPDIVVGNLDGGYHLLRNSGAVGAGNHRSAIRLRGDGKHVSRDAAGARVRVHTTAGRVLTSWVQIGTSLGSGSDTELLVGTGTDTVARIDVRWPNGKTQRFDGDLTDHRIELTYGRDRVGSRPLAER